MLQKLLKFLSSEAWEQRARDRERVLLHKELGHIVERTPVLTAQLERLNKRDSEAALERGRRAMQAGLRQWAQAPRRNVTISAMVEDDACLGGGK